ncbi:MAG: GNAT family N-acetyltransferase [Vampirovibrionales bacterium]
MTTSHQFPHAIQTPLTPVCISQAQEASLKQVPPSFQVLFLTPTMPETTFQALSELACRTFTETFGHLYLPEVLTPYLEAHFAIEALKQENAKPDRYYGLVYVDHTLAGYFKCYTNSTQYLEPETLKHLQRQGHERLCFLERLYFDRHYQGTGLAHSTLAYILQLAKHHWRASHLHLTVWENNIKAQRLYQHWGFKSLSQTLYYVEGAKPDVEFVYGRSL